jgi:hypothetical protein
LPTAVDPLRRDNLVVGLQVCGQRESDLVADLRGMGVDRRSKEQRHRRVEAKHEVSFAGGQNRQHLRGRL